MDTPKLRPYWHVDLKWMFGIIAFISLWLALFMNAFATLTEKQNATTVTSSVVANTVDSSGVDIEGGIAQLKAQAALLPDGAELPVPNMPWLKITKSDLLNKSTDEIKSQAISQLTAPIYEQGLDKTTQQFTQDVSQQIAFKQQVGLLGVISKQTHEMLVVGSKIALASSLIWFAGLIYFSAGWGRLVSPGVVLMLVSPVGVVVGSLLGHLTRQNQSFLAIIPQSVTANLASAINGTYRTAFLAGLALLVVAGVGRLTSKTLARRKTVV